ncbi:hypothetical protein HZA39_03910 [Candidatus Peregrinibacteria bacterium]|nr:hypothetical protein [Candidatus Peregrinibacteria bacterium]
MKLILTASIKEAEFEPLKKVFPLEIVKVAAKKSLQGLGDNIKCSTKIPKTVLKKIYLTSTSGAGRAVFLLQISSQKSVLVMIKPKNDKQIGANMTVKNPKFKKILDKNLDLILTDLANKNFEEYEL